MRLLSHLAPRCALSAWNFANRVFEQCAGAPFSEEAGYVDGVVLPVDGGFMASGAWPEAASKMNVRTWRDRA